MELKEFLCNATGNELKKRIYLEPMLSVCGLEAGELYQGPRGIVPHRAWARISFYLVANQNPVKIGRQLRNHLDSHGFEDVEVQMLGYSYPVKTSVNIPERNMLEKTARQVYKKPLVIEPTQLGAGPAIAIRRGAWRICRWYGIGPGTTVEIHQRHRAKLNQLEELPASVEKGTLRPEYRLFGGWRRLTFQIGRYVHSASFPFAPPASHQKTALGSEEIFAPADL